MEYLDPSDGWFPLKINDDTTINLLSVRHISRKLIKSIYDLVISKRLANTLDFVGYTGDHIFYNTNSHKFKFIIYEFEFRIIEKSEAFSAFTEMIYLIDSRFLYPREDPAIKDHILGFSENDFKSVVPELEKYLLFQACKYFYKQNKFTNMTRKRKHRSATSRTSSKSSSQSFS